MSDRRTSTSHRSSVPATPEVLSSFSTDDVYSKFLDNDFNVTAFTSQSIQLQKTAQHQQHLQKGIKLLQDEINGQVRYYF